jgi:hypothetical protein
MSKGFSAKHSTAYGAPYLLAAQDNGLAEEEFSAKFGRILLAA